MATRHVVQLTTVTSEVTMTEDEIITIIRQALNARRVFLESALIDEVKE